MTNIWLASILLGVALPIVASVVFFIWAMWIEDVNPKKSARVGNISGYFSFFSFTVSPLIAFTNAMVLLPIEGKVAAAILLIPFLMLFFGDKIVYGASLLAPYSILFFAPLALIAALTIGVSLWFILFVPVLLIVIVLLLASDSGGGGGGDYDGGPLISWSIFS